MRADHPGTEIFLDAFGRGLGAELRRKRVLNCCPWVWSLTHSPAVIQFAGGDGRGMPHDGDEFVVAARLYA
jgi:hypothetical protein